MAPAGSPRCAKPLATLEGITHASVLPPVSTAVEVAPKTWISDQNPAHPSILSNSNEKLSPVICSSALCIKLVCNKCKAPLKSQSEEEKDEETQKASLSPALADPAGMPATIGMCFVLKSAKGQIVFSGGAQFFSLSSYSHFCFV